MPLGVDAFVPLKELGKNNIKRAADHFKVGDELPLAVVEFDKENKRIVLSVTEYLKGKEKEVVDDYLTEHSLTPTTLKEMVDDVPELEESPEEGKGRKSPAKKKEKEEAETEADAEEAAAAEEAPAEAEAEAKPKKTTRKKKADDKKEDAEEKKDDKSEADGE